MCVISLSYVFYIFQHWNFLEKGFFCRRFHRSEGPLPKRFFQIKVEEDSKFPLAQITLKYFKKWHETVAAHRVFTRWIRVDIRPWLCMRMSQSYINQNVKFFWNFLKYFQKLPSPYIFINCINLSKFVKFVKIVFDTYLNFIKLFKFLKFSDRPLQNFKFFVFVWRSSKRHIKSENEISQKRRLKRMRSEWSKSCFCKKIVRRDI